MEGIFKHEQSLVETDDIGNGTRIWAFAHILAGAKVGSDCNVCDHVFIEGDVVVGDRVTIKCGVQLWDGTRIGSDVFIGPNATFTNDSWPRSREWPTEFEPIVVEDGASIGANATILPGTNIGRGAMIGAGAVVTRSVPPHAVVVGNPARIVRYASNTGSFSQTSNTSGDASEQVAELIEGVSLDSLPIVHDMRGNLIAREVGKGLPFEPKRVFIIVDVPSTEVRGEHAHKQCHQLLICLKGRVSCVVDNGRQRAEHCLDSPDRALHIPPMTWGTQYKYSEDAVLMVLASHEYDANDYIRDYGEFRDLQSVS